jgi:glycosyltransferase involved in cell wall biosynthesis
MKLLHITAHMGGGVGKVLSRLVESSSHRADGIEHTIACLETPEKEGFVDHARRFGAKVVCGPNARTLDALVHEADIVQLEWWHHPITARWMGTATAQPMRLVVWSHISGLGTPTLPAAFLALPHRFLLTSTCSLAADTVQHLPDAVRERIGVVFSSGGFDDLPPTPVRGDDALPSTGYMGTLNFAKLHPQMLDFIAAVDTPGFRLELVGDPTTAPALLSAARARGIENRIAALGYSHEVASVLAGWDIFAYLLNPLHYGTAENALLEAMAMGVVPVVLDNPAERALVRHEDTGLVVRDPASFAHAIERLTRDTRLRHRLSAHAAREVRDRFSITRTADALRTHYDAVMREDKRPMDFRAVFGNTPADWFRSCQGDEQWRFDDDAPQNTDKEAPPLQLLERTKGSVFHYRDTFPDDPRLARWARTLET